MKDYVLWTAAVLVLALMSFAAHAQFGGTHVTQSQGQSQSQGNIGLGSGNVTKVPVTINSTPQSELEYSGDYTVKNVPNVVVPNIYPTAPCMGSSALGGSVAGFGVGFGTSWIYENCEHRENARLLHGMGDITNAKISLCMQTTMANHPMCAKPAQQPAKVGTLTPKQISEEERRRAVQHGLTVGSDGTLWKWDHTGQRWEQAKLDPVAGQLK